MMNSPSKGYVVTGVVALVLAGFAFKTTFTGGDLSVCGKFCQRFGCPGTSGRGSSADQSTATTFDSLPTSVNLDASKVSVSCQLSGKELGERMNIFRELKAGVLSTRKLDDGYELSFPGTQVWAGKLFDFVSAERQCCPFFLFELTFEPQDGPVRLALRGGEEVKEFLDNFVID